MLNRTKESANISHAPSHDAVETIANAAVSTTTDANTRPFPIASASRPRIGAARITAMDDNVTIIAQMVSEDRPEWRATDASTRGNRKD